MNNSIDRTLISGLVIIALVGGLVFSPIFTGQKAEAVDSCSPITKSVLLIAGETVVQVAPDNPVSPGGRWYHAMTWNGTIPGPVISVDQGDCLGITVINNGVAIHTLDFHAGNGPSNAIGCKDSGRCNTA